MCQVSIALATYNGGKYISSLLDSIVHQTLKPFEIIVFDDNSTDNTCLILKQYSNLLPLFIHVNESSVGVIENFKRAVSKCTGDYIAFCDQDDIWFPNKLEKSVNKLTHLDGPLPALVFTDLIVVDEELRTIADSYWKHRKLFPHRETFASLLWGNFVTGLTMVINRSMAHEVTRMPNSVLMHDYWIATIAYGFGRYGFVESPTALYRQHNSNVTNNDQVTLNFRLRQTINFILGSTSYLLFQLQQANLFYKMYSERMSPKNHISLTNFLKMRYRSPLYRKWCAFKVKFLNIHG